MRTQEPHERGAISSPPCSMRFSGSRAAHRRPRPYRYGRDRLCRKARCIRPGRTARRRSRKGRRPPADDLRARADYCPPVDLTFGDYLRALITADIQVVPQDRLGYRIAIVEAFRARGIYPKGLRSLAVDNLVWDRPSDAVRALLRKRPLVLRPYANEYAYLDNRDAADPRRDIFEHLARWRGELHVAVQRLLRSLDEAQRDVLAEDMGRALRPGRAAFEVRSLQFTRKASPAGPGVPQGLLSIVQARAEAGGGRGTGSFLFRGGCTIVVDLRRRRRLRDSQERPERRPPRGRARIPRRRTRRARRNVLRHVERDRPVAAARAAPWIQPGDRPWLRPSHASGPRVAAPGCASGCIARASATRSCSPSTPARSPATS
jgi:hypothetical protein